MLLNDDLLVHHGYLRRRRYVDKIIEPLPVINWIQSFVVLHNGSLYIYANELSNKPEKATSLFGFTKCCRCSDEVSSKIAWPFKVVNMLVEKDKTFYFSAASEKDMNTWISVIQGQLLKINNRRLVEDDPPHSALPSTSSTAISKLLTRSNSNDNNNNNVNKSNGNVDKSKNNKTVNNAKFFLPPSNKANVNNDDSNKNKGNKKNINIKNNNQNMIYYGVNEAAATEEAVEEDDDDYDDQLNYDMVSEQRFDKKKVANQPVPLKRLNVRFFNWMLFGLLAKVIHFLCVMFFDSISNILIIRESLWRSQLREINKKEQVTTPPEDSNVYKPGELYKPVEEIIASPSPSSSPKTPRQTPTLSQPPNRPLPQQPTASSAPQKMFFLHRLPALMLIFNFNIIPKPDELYFWNGSPSDGEKFMKKVTDMGVFMIREASKDSDGLTLLVRMPSSVAKYKIFNKDGRLCFGKSGPYFDNLNQLIEHHKQNNLPNGGDKLTKPYRSHYN
ncbi:hypothetical protein HELRODRAFT_162157 [Helobdella robusta]|uniref:SH2 domain-containing protein n=1 Tax=Helobdella robusta TaxID=6412 RepID=T1ESA5_HELRO|nr:hypothetical protein HELRODRAFT_162157 [Helobdella robusta]ESN98704.1 hypothetical protein HELRODRAFT_162157 [Helobdella robusta]